MAFDLQHAIDEFCGRISVARSQDDAIRQEVASHLRAKVDYYLNKRQLTEQEAFMLASQTMGDPDQFAAEMRGVHRTERVTGQTFGLLSVFGMLLFIHAMAFTLYHMGHVLLNTSMVIMSITEKSTFCGTFQIAWLLISYTVPICVVLLFGKVVKGYGQGIMAEWVRKRASLSILLIFAMAIGVFTYWELQDLSPWLSFLISVEFMSNKGFVRPLAVLEHINNDRLEGIFFFLKDIVVGVLAYLACWLICLKNKRDSVEIKAVFATFAYAMLLLCILFCLIHVHLIPIRYPFPCTANGAVLNSGLLSLAGWLAFRLRTRRMRVA